MNQGFDNDVLDLVKQKGFYLQKYIRYFGKFKKKKLSNRETYYSSLTGKEIFGKEYEHILNVWKRFEVKRWKIMTDCI